MLKFKQYISEAMGPDHVGLKMHPTDGTKYIVTTVGSNVKGKIKPGEVLHDTQVDDMKDMGLQIKHEKTAKKMDEANVSEISVGMKSRYIKKAKDQMRSADQLAGTYRDRAQTTDKYGVQQNMRDKSRKMMKKSDKRSAGIDKAADSIANQDKTKANNDFLRRTGTTKTDLQRAKDRYAARRSAEGE